MNFQIATVIATVIVGAMSGCSLCCGPYDYHYPTIGGKHQRVDPVHGRVGSIFSDPLAPRAAGAAADSNLLPPPELRTNEDSEFDDRSLDDELDLDGFDGDLEDISPLKDEDLPDIKELEQSNPGVFNKKTRLDRRRPLR